MSKRLDLMYGGGSGVRCVLTLDGPFFFACDLVVGLCGYENAANLLRSKMPRGTAPLKRVMDVVGWGGVAQSRIILLTTDEATLLAGSATPRLRPISEFFAVLRRCSVFVTADFAADGAVLARFCEPGERGSSTIEGLCLKLFEDVAGSDDSLPSTRPNTPEEVEMRGVPYARVCGVPSTYLPVCALSGGRPAPFVYESASEERFVYEPVEAGPSNRGWDVTPVVVRTRERYFVFVPRRVEVSDPSPPGGEGDSPLLRHLLRRGVVARPSVAVFDDATRGLQRCLGTPT